MEHLVLDRVNTVENLVDLKTRIEQFSFFASSYGFKQPLPLLLSGKLIESELRSLNECVFAIIKARGGIENNSTMLEEANFDLVRETLKKLAMSSVGNVIELGDNLFPHLTKQLTNALSNTLRRSGFLSRIALLQRNPNIRIKIGSYSAEKEHAYHPLSTSKMHCDIWAGAPKYLYIGLLEIINIANGPKVQFGQVDQFPLKLAQKLINGYDDPEAVMFLKTQVKRTVTSESGHLHVIDAYMPHQTIYPGDGLRISIDFRFTLKDEATPELLQELVPLNFCLPYEWQA